MRYFLLEQDQKFEMSEQRAQQLEAENVITQCPWQHTREFVGPVKIYHLTNGDYGVSFLELHELVRDVS